MHQLRRHSTQHDAIQLRKDTYESKNTGFELELIVSDCTIDFFEI